MTQLDSSKNNKSLNPLDSLLAVLGLILVALVFIACLSYLDYTTVSHSLSFFEVSSLEQFAPSPSPSPPLAGEGLCGNERPGYLDAAGDVCDVFDGNWVWDDSYPLYQSRDCPFIDGEFRCLQNGRPDSFFTKWRWQPKSCNLPRFDAKNMLEKLRNRRLAIVGDSLGRNQWESLLCMLSSAIPNKTSIYEVNGKTVEKSRSIMVLMFKDYNCTIEYYRAPFLVVQTRPPPGAPQGVRMTLRVDQLTWTSTQWRDADVLILNTGHWWNHDKTIGVGCYFQEGQEVKMNMSIETAFRRSIETVVDWIGREINTSKTKVFFRTYSYKHFRGGNWNSGGNCHLEKLPDFGTLPSTTEEHVETVLDVLSKRSNMSQVINLDLMRITNMTWPRKDAHPSVYHLGPGKGAAPLDHQDCSHWCMPGVPDSWNELLYVLLLKRGIDPSLSSTEPFQAPF